MADTERLMHYLVEWEERRRAGSDVSAEEICPDDLTLQDELRKRIVKRRRLQAFLGGPSTMFAGRDRAPAAIPTIPGFEILEVIGSGGMGIVYKARDTKLNRTVALKMILTGAGATSEERKRFRSEAAAVAALQHPNIVQIHEIGETEGHLYLALEYVDGGTLAQHLRHTPVAPHRAAELLFPLAEAVSYAHSRGIIHRDLKPANVLLAITEPSAAHHSPLTTHKPKIADFGLAKQIGTDQGATQTGSIIGSPNYMAPEQASGHHDRIGPATDVYALGAILYEALTGRPPFQAETPFEVLEMVVRQEVVAPTRLAPKTPRDLETICLKCLQKEPAKRYATAAELAADLKRFLDGRPVLARPVSNAERFGRWCRRNPRVVALSTALILVFLVGLGGIVWQWQRARHEAAIAIQKHDEAVRERNRAEANSRRAHEIVERMAAVGSQLRHQRGQEDGGRRIMEEAIKFYEGFFAEKSDDPAVILEAAKAWNFVSMHRDQLGQHAAAVDAERRSLELFDLLLAREPTKENIYTRARHARRLGHYLIVQDRNDEAAAAYQEAADAFRRLSIEDGQDLNLRTDVANTLMNLAQTVQDQQPNRAEAVLLEALALHEQNLAANPKAQLFRVETALVCAVLGELLWRRDQSSRSQDYLRRAEAIVREIVREEPGDANYRMYQVRRLQFNSRISTQQGRCAAAEQEIRAALAELDRIQKDFPRDSFRAGAKLYMLHDLAEAQRKAGKSAEAVATLRQILARRASMAATYPDVELVFRDVIQMAHRDLWTLLAETGHVDEAAALVRQVERAKSPDASALCGLALAIAHADSKFHDSATAIRLAQRATELAPTRRESWMALGTVQLRAGDYAGAIRSLTKSASLQSAYAPDLGLLLALAHHRAGDPAAARRHRNEAQAWLDKNGTIDPDLPALRAEVAAQMDGK